jgi:dephospho-CoA kinase
MIRIGILGDIGSGKSYVAKNFGHPVFNADFEVGKLYKKNRKIFNKLEKILPKYIYSFPIKKNEISNAILANKSNLKKIIKIVHLELRKKMNIFLSKNRNKKIVILDIPLLLENKINKKSDILIFVKSNKSDILKRLKKRENFNPKLLSKFKNIQLPLDYKKKDLNLLLKIILPISLLIKV